MGMMGVGPGNQRAMVQQALMQAKGERDTLKLRIATTQESIRTLEEGLPELLANPGAPEYLTERMLSALILTNLIQLRANLKEGTERIDYLNQAISQMESPVHKASLVHPAKN